MMCNHIFRVFLYRTNLLALEAFEVLGVGHRLFADNFVWIRNNIVNLGEVMWLEATTSGKDDMFDIRLEYVQASRIGYEKPAKYSAYIH